MCGRFTLVRLAEFTDLFPWINGDAVDWTARYNIAPSQPALVVTNRAPHRVEVFQWGLVPVWAKDGSIGNKMINARAETLLEKPAFKRLAQRRRCVVPASGFYEWRKEPGSKAKTPMYIRLRDQPAFALAGLWDVWRGADGSELPTFTLITTSPNALMQDIHDRMPVILDSDSARRWLAPEDLPDAPVEVLQPFDAARMEAYPVSRAVNSPANEGPALVCPVEAPGSLFG